MKATLDNIGQSFTVRLFNHKSVRHYGGRDITTTAVACPATLIGIQDGHAPYIVSLDRDCDGYKAGRKIAISHNEFQV